MAKKKRTKKTSQGVHGGGGKVTLSPLQKVLLGGGRYRAMRPIGTRPAKTEEVAK